MQFGPQFPNLRLKWLQGPQNFWCLEVLPTNEKSEVLTTNENGLSEATTASEVKSDLRFGICGPNCICNHVCLGCLGLFWTNLRRRLRQLASTRPVGFAAGKNWQNDNQLCSSTIAVGFLIMSPACMMGGRGVQKQESNSYVIGS